MSVCVCRNKHAHVLLECFFPEIDGKDIYLHHLEIKWNYLY